MTFTAEDLKRLKEFYGGKGFIIPFEGGHISLWALLARMEAAEHGCQEAEKVLINPIDMNEGKLQIALETWRKECGL